MFRYLGALVADLLAVLLFVAIGLIQHGYELTVENIVLVGWPFAVGVLLGHLAIRAWRFPFRIWPHGLFVWAITLCASMAIRTLFSAGTEASFVIVAASVTLVLMIGWRAVALWVTRGERREEVAARREARSRKRTERAAAKEARRNAAAGRVASSVGTGSSADGGGPTAE